MPITRTSPLLKITIIIFEDMDEIANVYQAHNDPVDPGSDDGEEAPDYDDDEENDTCSSYVALDDVTVFEAAELDAIALLADAVKETDCNSRCSLYFTTLSVLRTRHKVFLAA